ncbi:TetR/AcrR family transcriptional regulator [Acidovorax sp. NCPPB 4044]|uniref:TetR/AcrR family transcriptional regulator n=1 Tax=Acidovorax sp. NCPPB 4044 TaxID=2940490 RepID=UPI002304AF3C|nr:TetR/AcrR family transcriptional regulator [Acidovorax sp. NCPPB 4044]MDA8519261.1 TetR/AcrR family transcriptional regulator [Acidovorax sp. NCPPB 4044]
MPKTEGHEKSRRPSPRGRPTARRAQELRQTIIEVASVLMLQGGYEGTSIDAIAAAAGVTKRTIYSRFASKENLLREVLTTAALPALRLDPEFPPGLGIQEKLERIGMEMNDTLLHPDMQRWLRFAIGGIAQRPELAPFIHALIEQYLELLARMLGPALASEALRADDFSASVKIFATLISAPAHNLVTFSLPPGSREEQADFIRKAAVLFLAGCTKA